MSRGPVSSFSLDEIENLFIEKLQERYKLNEKDIRRAFGKFDRDNNGLLDIEELKLGIQQFLNGVSQEQILALVDRYDVNGDGKISYEEFLQFVRAHKPPIVKPVGSTKKFQRNQFEEINESRVLSKEQWSEAGTDDLGDDDTFSIHDYSPKPMKVGKRFEKEDIDDETRSEASSTLDASNPKELENRLKIFLQNLKAYLVKQAVDTSKTRSTGLSGAAAQENYQHLSLHTSQQHESIAKSILGKLFAPYTAVGAKIGAPSSSNPNSIENCVEFNNFSRVMRSFHFPGAPPVKLEALQLLFDLCSFRAVDRNGAAVHVPILNEEGRKVASPALLVKLIFGNTMPTRFQFQRAPAVTRHRPNPIAADGGYVRALDAERAQVGFGPVRLNGLSQPNQNSVGHILRGGNAAEVPSLPGASTDAISLVLPLRFVSRKSRTALAVPTNFDTISNIKRSNALPNHELRRKHVFGMSSTLYSGSAISILPFNPTDRNLSSRQGQGRKTPTAWGENQDSTAGDRFLDTATVIYAAAGLGVIHDLTVNKQHFYNGHSEDVTCLALSSDGALAATGCMGKEPTVHVWSTDIVDCSEPLLSLGKGFFYRGVCALEFSTDSQYLVAVNCDDYSTLGMFDLSTGELVFQVSAQHGLPPQIKWVRYAPGQHFTQYITKEHAIACDMYGTVGERHIKLWSFRRPQKDGPVSLMSKSCSMGKSGAPMAKVFLCCGFIPCDDKDRNYDFVAGGSNGVVYLFKKAVCTAFAQALRGKIQCLEVAIGGTPGDCKVILGGVGGVVKVLDGRTLTLLQSFSLLDAVAVPKGGRPTSAPRPRSASAGRSATPRALLAAPKSRLQSGAGKPSSAGPAGDIISGGYDTPVPEDTTEEQGGSRVVTGLAVPRTTRSSHLQDQQMQVPLQTIPNLYVIATLGTGRAVRLDLSSSSSSPSSFVGKNLFHFHAGPVSGLAVDVTAARRLCASVGDDKQLMLWDAVDCELLAKTALKNPSRACHIDKTNSFIAVGCTAGGITLYYLTDQLNKKGNFFKLEEVAYRKDAKGECTEVKFSPSNDMIAVGSRDDSIYIYSCSFSLTSKVQGRSTVTSAACVLRSMHKLKGHSAIILSIDWSADSALIQSVCGAYELLCWDVSTGKLNSNVNPADVRWKTKHCKLGFNLMGIWPPYSNGSDVNAVDVCMEKGLVVTANDEFGLTKLFNYPCVVKAAPHKAYSGHSAFVMSCRFLYGGDALATVGGRDATVQIWDCLPPASNAQKSLSAVRTLS